MDTVAPRRDAEEPTDTRQTGWRNILLCSLKDASNDNIGILAAGVAFYAFLALIPMLGATVMTYGLLADPHEVGQHLQVLFRLLPGDAAKLVGAAMISVTKASAGKTGLGLGLALLLAMYGVMNGASAIITALDIVHGAEEKHGWLHAAILAVGMAIGALLVGLSAILAIGALAFLEALIPAAPHAVTMLIKIGFWLAAAIAASGVIATVYRYAPNRRPAKWRWLIPGALFATAAWLVMTLGFGLYAANFAHYNVTYGALGSVIALLMWLYLSAYVVLIGAELNSAIEDQEKRGSLAFPPSDCCCAGTTAASMPNSPKTKATTKDG
jgi:membrane protein